MDFTVNKCLLDIAGITDFEIPDYFKNENYQRWYNDEERKIVDIVESRDSKINELKEKGLDPINYKIDNTSLFKYLNDNDPYISSIAFIIYRLWDHEEMGAAAASVYGVFKNSKGIRTNFGNDVIITKAYDEYKYIIKNLAILKRLNENDESFEVGMKLLNIKNMTPLQFKEWFIQRSTLLNSEFLMRIGKAASQAYDENEVDKNKMI